MTRLNYWLLLILGIVLLLRLPSLWEPYWYGDEQIYLAIGQAMNRGAVLYRDIWDNKPPLLYVLYAIVPTLLWAKAAATVFVLGTVLGVYRLTRSLIISSRSLKITEQNQKFTETGSASFWRNSAIFSPDILAVSAALLVGTLLSLPLLEGTIANAELFFTLPIVWAGYLILRHAGPDPASIRLFNRFRIKSGMTIGFLMAIAFLFKVPAVFDFLGMFFFVLIVFTRGGLASTTSPPLSKVRDILMSLIRFFIPIFVAFIVPVILVFAYFFLNHALKDFVIAAFSQNASYVSVDTGPLSKLSNPLFIKAFILMIGALLLVIGYWFKKINKELLFLALWFGFSLYGALLSGRPYMHYLLQIVPPAVVLFVYIVSSFWQMHEVHAPRISNLSDSGVLTSFVPRMTLIAVSVVFLGVLYYLSQMFHGAFHLPFPQYYQNFYDYASERKSWNAYASFFDSRTLNSYSIAKYVDDNSNSNDSIFVWGDAASVYVLSERKPATRFIQAHHLTTIDPVNYDLIIEKLSRVKPKFIIIKKPEGFAFPKLDELVVKNYKEAAVFEDLHVYRIWQ